MIVWSGRGFLSVLVLAIVLFALDKILPQDQKEYAYIISLFIAGIFSWFMGKKWNTPKQTNTEDTEMREQIILKPSHSLFWIKMQYWGLIFGAIGIFMLVKQFI